VDNLSIGVDGFNLALRHGTGVATYGIVLANTLASAGARVEGVFGLDTGSDPALREVNFFDLLEREAPKSKSKKQLRQEWRQLMRDALRPGLRLIASDVPLTDRVEKAAFASRLPNFDRLVSAPRLFEVAFAHFNIYKRFVKLRIANPPSIMHWTYPVPVELEGAHNIYTLHDLVPLRLPYTTLDMKASYHGVVEQCVRRGAHICTVSEASRKDIIDHFGIDEKRITNTYQASPPPPSAVALSAEEDARMIEGIFGLPPKGFLLFFGAIEPKKNIGRLIEAYLSIQTKTPLVIVGSRSWQADDELRLLSDAGGAMPGRNLSQRIIRLEHLPRLLLLRMIRSARAVLFPSLYEGFGLPILEAMQMGTPVLTSNLSAMPEVAGSAAILVDPYDVASIAEGLRRIDDDPVLREAIGREGALQAENFSIARYSERLERMYRAVLASV
jgi:glycosyltransferase involved in cell wall biosynthesis